MNFTENHSYIMLLLLLLTSSMISSLSSSVYVTTNYGTVEGVENGNMYKFVNIPFAKPPIGNLRFMPPVKMDGWNNTWNGANYSNQHFGGYIPACPQIGYSDIHPFNPHTVTEDCLYLNVFTPNNASNDSKYGVMIWIYGGSFISGWSTGGSLYDPTATIDYIKDIIIVSINYRIGLFGGLYDNQYNTGIKGNQGFMDQQMAIEWVYDNIEYFGGDPNRLTIYGESAGAHSVALHLLYNNEYLQSGIMESPPIGLPLRNVTTWYDVPQQMSKVIGCDNYDIGNASIIDCWQSVDWNVILTAQTVQELRNNWLSMPFTPTVGTDLIRYQPVEGFMYANISNTVPPFIVGVNRDESFAFINSSIKYTYQYMYAYIAATFGIDNAELILDYYHVDANASDFEYILSRISTDSAFRCPVRNATMNAMTIGNNVWYYHFDVVDTAFYERTFYGRQQCYNRTCHTAELFYIWLPINASLFGVSYDNETVNIAHQLQTYWSNFAKHMDPNMVKNIWMEYETDSEMILQIIDDNFNHSIYIDENVCDFWDKIGYAGNYCQDCTKKTTKGPTMKPTESMGHPPNKQISGGIIAGAIIAGVCLIIIIAYFIGKCIFERKRPYKKDEVLMAKSNYRRLATD